MECSNHYKWMLCINRVLLGLLMLIPGIMKAMMGPAAVGSMLATIGFPLATFFAWVLIIAEIGSGLFLIINYKSMYASYLAAFILIVATLVYAIPETFKNPFMMIGQLVFHLLAISNYLLVASCYCDMSCCKESDVPKKAEPKKM